MRTNCPRYRPQPSNTGRRLQLTMRQAAPVIASLLSFDLQPLEPLPMPGLLLHLTEDPVGCARTELFKLRHNLRWRNRDEGSHLGGNDNSTRLTLGSSGSSPSCRAAASRVVSGIGASPIPGSAGLLFCSEAAPLRFSAPPSDVGCITS